jgi:hypothetical protein
MRPESVGEWSRSSLMPPADRAALVDHVAIALTRYGLDAVAVRELPVLALEFPRLQLPLRLVQVALPTWAADCAVAGSLAVPVEACAEGYVGSWEGVDWWLAAFLLLEAWHERAWESEQGPVHSYSGRLKDWDTAVWQRAWVNRIALFLRTWALQCSGPQALGPLPPAQVCLTHDIDAVRKTAAIRLKQSAFIAFNALRMAAAGRVGEAWRRVCHAVRFLLAPGDWSATLGDTLNMEHEAGMRSRLHVFAGRPGFGFRRWLFDPGYQLNASALQAVWAAAAREGWVVGLHGSFDSWDAASELRAESERLGAACPVPVRTCRQHWLRFSWQRTWAAQAEAGLHEDATLMFNDRPGWRNAAALAWQPWDASRAQAHALRAWPTVLMDSHLFDYQPLNGPERRAALCQWLDELVAVRGQAAVLWHPHTLSSDYGWREGFAELLAQIQGRPIEVVV